MASSFLMMTDCDKKEYTFSRINYKEFILIDDEKQIQRGPKEGESKLVLNFNSNHHFVRNFNKTFQENNLQNMFLVKEKQEEGRRLAGLARGGLVEDKTSTFGCQTSTSSRQASSAAPERALVVVKEIKKFMAEKAVMSFSIIIQMTGANLIL